LRYTNVLIIIIIIIITGDPGIPLDRRLFRIPWIEIVAIVLNGDSSPSPRKRATVAPTFRHISIVGKWSPISATAELLLAYIKGEVTRFKFGM